MYKKFLLIIGLGIVILILFSYFTFKNDQDLPLEKSDNLQAITIGGKKLNIDIADEPHEQARGLSGRKSMTENEGMLFVFPQPLVPAFWMKEMNFSLDLIWIDASGKIIGIEKNVSPDTYPKTFSPPSPIKYVLEVNAGWSDRNDIRIGDLVSF